MFKKGHIPSEETKLKIKETFKINGYPRCGKKHSEKTKEKIRNSLKGKHLSEETKQKLSKAGKGRKLTAEHKRKIGIAHKGKKLSEKERKRLSDLGKTRTGSKNACWRGGITKQSLLVRGSFKYIEWKQNVFIRDKFTCQKCGDNRGKNLNAHHIIPFSELIKEAQFCMPLFDLYQACMSYNPLWNIDNGITLCKLCHQKIHNHH
jgi:5-methylcytosine-specific restriction endonuclease McrA